MYIVILVIAAVLLALATLGFGGKYSLLAGGLFVWLVAVILRTAGIV